MFQLFIFIHNNQPLNPPNLVFLFKNLVNCRVKNNNHCEDDNLLLYYFKRFNALTKFIIGHHFQIFTYQISLKGYFFLGKKSLKGLLTRRVQIHAQNKWLAKLLRFSCEIIYTLGRDPH